MQFVAVYLLFRCIYLYITQHMLNVKILDFLCVTQHAINEQGVAREIT